MVRRLPSGFCPGHIRLAVRSDTSAGIVQVIGQLGVLEHGIQRHDDAPSLPHGALRYHELRHILEVEGDPVARVEAELGEGRREGGRHPVELPVAQRRIEVMDRGRTGPPLGRGFEQREAARVRRLDRELMGHVAIRL